MTTALGYFLNVRSIQEDIGQVKEINGTIGTVLEKAKEALEIPGKLEDKLRNPAEALDLPAPVVAALGVAPYGIGTAIKTIDRIAGETADVINEQADIMGALDDAWSTPRSVVGGAKNVQSAAAVTLTGLEIDNSFRLNEAEAIAASLGNQNLFVDSELVTRLDAYNDIAENWFATKAATVAPLNAAINQLEAAADQVFNLIPDLSVVDDAFDVVLSVFQPLADAANAIEEALCVVFEVTPAIVVPPVVITPEIVIPPVYVLGVLVPGTGITIPAVITPGFTIPAVTVDVCAILEDIGNAVGAVQSFVENAINSVLSTLGFDLFGALDSLKDDLLSPLDPVFDVIESIQNAAQSIINTLNDAVSSIQDSLSDMIADLQDAVDFGYLFENTEYGDEAAGLVDFADTLVGTSEEDALYGLKGDDTLTGEGGTDFLFGGAGNDRMESGDGDDEMYGGAGNDIGIGGDGDNLLDGGSGFDILVGGGGADTLIGGGGFDLLIGGQGADDFVFGEGGGFDYVIGFRDNLDELAVDSSLVAEGTTAEQVVSQFATVRGGNTIVDFGEDVIIIAGLRNANALVDDIIFV